MLSQYDLIAPLKYFVFILFLYFWLCWVFVAECGLSLVVKSGGSSLVEVHGLLIVVASLVVEWRLQGTWSSEVGVHWLTCPVACGIFTKLSPALTGGFLTTGPWGMSSSLFCKWLIPGQILWEHSAIMSLKVLTPLTTFVSASREQTKATTKTKENQVETWLPLCWNSIALLKAHLRGGKYCSSQPAWPKKTLVPRERACHPVTIKSVHFWFLSCCNLSLSRPNLTGQKNVPLIWAPISLTKCLPQDRRSTVSSSSSPTCLSLEVSWESLGLQGDHTSQS